MKFRLYFAVLAAALVLASTGCTLPEKNNGRMSLQTSGIPKTKNSVGVSSTRGANLIPDLAGGAEALNRTGAHSAALPNILYYSGPKQRKLVALTFDDGPDVVFTSKILDILKQNGVKATFFLVGTRAEAHPEIVRRIAAEGHAVGNHTWDHHSLARMTPDQIKAEVLNNDQALSTIIGYHPSLFRPPYGLASPLIVQEVGSLGCKVIDWSVDTRDWAGTSPKRIMKYVRKEVRPGAIVLMHSAGGRNEKLTNTVTVLPQIISLLKTQGYTFVTVPQLLQIPGERTPIAKKPQ